MIIFKTAGFYLSLIGFLITVLLFKMMHAPAPPPAHPVEPALNPFKNTLAASGIVESIDKNIAIGSPEEGLVIKVYVQVWDDVVKGQPLFQLDSRTLEAQLLTQESNEEVSRANLERLEDQLSRLMAVKDIRAVSKEEVRTKQNDVKVAKAQLKASQAAVQQTKRLIDRLIVRAPKNGKILQNNIREGEYVSKSTATMILGDLKHLQVRADIDEQNAGRFDPKGKAVAYPKNNTTVAIPLEFVRIEPYVLPKVSLTGASDERVDTRVLQVIYSFDQPKNYHIYVGQQVDLFIEKKPLEENEAL